MPDDEGFQEFKQMLDGIARVDAEVMMVHRCVVDYIKKNGHEKIDKRTGDITDAVIELITNEDKLSGCELLLIVSKVLMTVAMILCEEGMKPTLAIGAITSLAMNGIHQITEREAGETEH